MIIKVKISINKFYRVTGKAIKLQESSQMLRFRTFMRLSISKERNNPTAFKTDSITTRLIYKSYILNSTMEKIAKKARTGSLLIPI
jgi:hypothetical protein